MPLHSIKKWKNKEDTDNFGDILQSEVTLFKIEVQIRSKVQVKSTMTITG